MIDWFQAAVLAVLQGLTEFLPISSSAHLVLPSLLLEWPDQGLAFDVAVHLGTLCAVLWYYRLDLLAMASAWSQSLLGGGHSDDSRLVWYLAAATLPAALFGLLGRNLIEEQLRTLPVIATTTLVFGLALGFADRRGASPVAYHGMNLVLAMLIGIAQAVALVPGVSRSGATITAGLFLGLGRQGAARFSFLMSIPVISAAAALKSWDLYRGAVPVDWLLLALGAALSGLVAYLSIALFMRWLDRVGMMPFVYYRVVLALALFAIYLLW